MQRVFTFISTAESSHSICTPSIATRALGFCPSTRFPNSRAVNLVSGSFGRSYTCEQSVLSEVVVSACDTGRHPAPKHREAKKRLPTIQVGGRNCASQEQNPLSKSLQFPS